jgi:NAD+ synthase
VTGPRLPDLEVAGELERITARVHELVHRRLRRKGVVVGISGGIDSSVVAALCARALGRDRVLGLTMHEPESSPETKRLAALVIEHLGVAVHDEPLGPVLAAAGCYRRRDAALRRVIPRYGDGWRCKLVLPGLLADDRLRIFSVVARSPDGEEVTARLPFDAYCEVVAATSFKQRTRKMLEYFHADRLGYAVAGTPNRLEYELGFFVKNGDGAADLKPIAHLYKTQVYQLAEALGIPREIRERPPTTDTYSLPQSQEEFYFSVPLAHLDACLHAVDSGVAASDVAASLGLATEQVERIFRDITAKRHAAAYLHAPPLRVDEIS